MNNEIYHHGILGQKWGVRRFQNKDGTRTAAGKKRYSANKKDDPAKEEKSSNSKKIKGVAVAGSAAVASALALYGTRKIAAAKKVEQKQSSEKIADSSQPVDKQQYVKTAGLEKAYRKALVDNSKTKFAKDIVDESVKAVQTAKRMSDESIRDGVKKGKLDLSKMTDKEMRDKINRELLERQYNSLFAPDIDTVTKGQKALNTTLTVAGSVLATASSALAIALAIKNLKGD